MSKHTEQAEKFMEDCGATMTVTFLRHAPHFENDKDSRDIYHVVIKREGKGKDNTMEFDFGQSLAKSVSPEDQQQARWGQKPQKREAPTAYDILACLQKWEVDGDVWEFAEAYGYEINSRESFNRIDKIHMAVIKEYRDVCRLFGDVMEQLQEIS